MKKLVLLLIASLLSQPAIASEGMNLLQMEQEMRQLHTVIDGHNKIYGKFEDGTEFRDDSFTLKYDPKITISEGFKGLPDFQKLPGFRIFTTENNHAQVGFISLVYSPAVDNAVHFQYVWTYLNHRRRGYATSAIQLLEREIRKRRAYFREATHFCITTSAQNKGMVSVQNKLGYSLYPDPEIKQSSNGCKLISEGIFKDPSEKGRVELRSKSGPDLYLDYTPFFHGFIRQKEYVVHEGFKVKTRKSHIELGELWFVYGHNYIEITNLTVEDGYKQQALLSAEAVFRAKFKGKEDFEGIDFMHLTLGAHQSAFAKLLTSEEMGWSLLLRTGRDSIYRKKFTRE